MVSLEPGPHIICSMVRGTSIQTVSTLIYLSISPRFLFRSQAFTFCSNSNTLPRGVPNSVSQNIYVPHPTLFASKRTFGSIGITNRLKLVDRIRTRTTSTSDPRCPCPYRKFTSVSAIQMHSKSRGMVDIDDPDDRNRNRRSQSSRKMRSTRDHAKFKPDSLQNLSYREMQKLCKDHGLPANGKTDAIRARLKEHFDGQAGHNAISISVIKNKETSSSAHNDDDYDNDDRSAKQTQSPSNITPAGSTKIVVTVTPSPIVKEMKTQLPKKRLRRNTKETSAKSEKQTNTASASTTRAASASASPSTPSPRKKRLKIEPGSLPPPSNWQMLYSIVEELRADRTAPLDSDGGEALPQTHLGPKVYRFQVLVALMLSSQTKDAVVGNAIRALQSHEGGLTVENINGMEDTVLNGLIRQVGFHNNKTKYLKKVARVLVDDYDGDIPPTADEMMKLSGIGPKMAYIIENIVFGTSSGIGVDTHMHRIFNNLKWVKSKTPEQTREQLEGWLPRQKWAEVNMLWVGFGQESQQQKEKILRKALDSSKPLDCLKLLAKVGLDARKEGKKYGLEDKINNVYMGGSGEGKAVARLDSAR